MSVRVRVDGRKVKVGLPLSLSRTATVSADPLQQRVLAHLSFTSNIKERVRERERERKKQERED